MSDDSVWVLNQAGADFFHNIRGLIDARVGMVVTILTDGDPHAVYVRVHGLRREVYRETNDFTGYPALGWCIYKSYLDRVSMKQIDAQATATDVLRELLYLRGIARDSGVAIVLRRKRRHTAFMQAKVLLNRSS